MHHLRAQIFGLRKLIPCLNTWRKRRLQAMPRVRKQLCVVKFSDTWNWARIYLGFPASSGSAERLFSIAGVLQRSRRSRLKWSTIEQLLCYRELRLSQIFGKAQIKKTNRCSQ
ncbi:unnamed protein product, partial [Allacma fusca]